MAIREVLESSSEDIVSGIGIAIPGPMDYQRGVAFFDGSNSKFRSLYQVDIRQDLEKALQFQGEIRFVNDAIAFGIGESWVGEGQGMTSSLALTLGTGFGSVLFKNDRPLLKGDSVPKNGCFWHLPFREGIADDYFSTRWLVNRYNELKGTNAIGVKEIADVFDSCVFAKQVFEEFGEMLGSFLHPWIMALALEGIIIGGNISRALRCFEPALMDGFQRKGLNPIIKESKLLESAALVGSARIHQEDYWNSLNKQIGGLIF